MSKHRSKEDIYDEEIAPLMSEIIKICEASKMAMVASFDISSTDDQHHRCTTALLQEEHNPPHSMLVALNILFSKAKEFTE